MPSSIVISTNAISMIATTGISEFCVIEIAFLISLIAKYEISSSKTLWSRNFRMALRMAILPLSIAFILLVIYKIAEIV